MIRLRTFGSVELESQGGEDLRAVLAQPKRLALLVYLASARPFRAHRRDDLLALFWPDLDDTRARDALNQALRFLRQALGAEAFVKRGAEDVGLDPERLWCDAVAFQEALETGQAGQALELYRGPFLQGFFIEEGGGFEEWVDRERAGLCEAAARGARQLADQKAEAGALTVAIDWGRKALEFAPDDERALRRLLRLHDKAGDRAGAFRAYESFVNRFEEQFGGKPSADTLALAEQLRSGKPLDPERGAAPLPAALAPPSGASAPPPATEERYRIERQLGEGGMATVYLARDLKHDRDVALKVLKPHVAEGLARERFIREIRIAGRLQHPNIVPLFDSGELNGQLFYVMPHVEGETLRERLAREGRLPIATVVHVLREMADALAYAHGQEVIHRDIKPGNILLTASRAVLSDFGIARAAHAARAPVDDTDLTLTRLGGGVGTPAYMAPEQAMGGMKVDHRTDLYALGVVGYEMLVGRRPFPGSTPEEILRAQLTEPLAPAETHRPDTPRWLATLVRDCLEADAGKRPRSAAEVAQRLDEQGPGRRSESSAHRKRGLVLGGLLAVGLAGALAGAVWWGTRSSGLQPGLIAVLPFEVHDPRLAVWREGMVDLLSRNLDDAGPLRTVSPTLSVRRWVGRVDRESAADMARRTGAGIAVYGSLEPMGQDSVRVRAGVYDAIARRLLGEIDLRDEMDRLDRLTDSLTVNLLREIGRTQPIGAVRRASIGSRSLPALKAFLQGEQYFRRTAWDSAVAYYTRATELDTTLALAFLRLSRVIGWQRIGGDSLSRALAVHAGRMNRGLSERDSLMVEAEALMAAMWPGFDDPSFWTHHRRLFTVLRTATERHPNDPEVWYVLGEARYTFQVSVPAILEAYDRAIELDSAFAPAYIHAIEVAMAAEGERGARRYIEPYLALKPIDVHADGVRLAERLLDPARARTPETDQLAARASADVLYHALDIVGYWPDSAETVLRLARLFAVGRPTAVPLFADAAYQNYQLAIALLHRGHLQQAYQLLRNERVNRRGYDLYYASAVFLGAVPEDSGAVFFERLRREPMRRPNGVILALPWASARGDTVSILEVAHRAATQAARTESTTARLYLEYLMRAAEAYLSLASRDTAEALRRFRGLPEAGCPHTDCPMERLMTAKLLAGVGRFDEAGQILGRELPYTYNPISVLWRLERARVADRLGREAEARDAFQYVSGMWGAADASLQSMVQEARGALDRLRRGRSF